jgi:serine/threonine protein kinase
VIHRDLKPANIKITPDGKVRALDFGLAKALKDAHPPSGETETATVAAGITETGAVMGTAAYMSPEQASRMPLDQRTDTWSVGCVLYEALTGKRTFAAQSTAELLVSILDGEPDWSLLPVNTPENIQRLLRRCLAKDLRQRLHDSADARLELDDTLSGRFAAVSPIAAPVKTRGGIYAGFAAGLALGFAGAAIWLTLRRPEPLHRVLRASASIARKAPASCHPGIRRSPFHAIQASSSIPSTTRLQPSSSHAA